VFVSVFMEDYFIAIGTNHRSVIAIWLMTIYKTSDILFITA